VRRQSQKAVLTAAPSLSSQLQQQPIINRLFVTLSLYCYKYAALISHFLRTKRSIFAHKTGCS